MIREMKNEDVEQIMKIWIEVSIDAHDFISKEHWNKNYSDVKKKYLPDSTTYVHTENDKVKGFISIHDNHYIGAIFVDLSSQGNGIGTKLINHAKKLYDNLELYCYKKNKKTVDFYKKTGFEIESEHVDEDTNEEQYFMKWKKSL